MSESIDRLRELLSAPLPGEQAHRLISDYPRQSALAVRNQKPAPRESAVLLLIYPGTLGWTTVLIRRPEYDGVHSGQVSFPGGKKEPGDRDLYQTALRESSEEIGIREEEVLLLGQLTDIYIPPSHFLVTPYVGLSRTTPVFVPDPVEVSRIIEVPLQDIFQKNTIKQKKIFISRLDASLDVRYFDIDGETIWGATAMILSEFREIAAKAAPFVD